MSGKKIIEGLEDALAGRFTTTTLPASPLTDEDAKALAWINEQARLFGKYGELSIPAIMERLDKAEATLTAQAAEVERLTGEVAKLTVFVTMCARDTYDRVSPLVKTQAREALAALPSPPITNPPAHEGEPT